MKVFPEHVIKALDCVTIRKKEKESYDHFITRILKNKLAIKVKTADLEDNMNILRLKEITDAIKKDVDRLIKYHKYHKILIEKLVEVTDLTRTMANTRFKSDASTRPVSCILEVF